METKMLPRTQNENILIEYKNCLFSDKIYAYFEFGMAPVFSNSVDDLMLPENCVTQPHYESGGYEVFGWNEDAQEHLYTGRLFLPKNVVPLV